jgi:hypothetical protein
MHVGGERSCFPRPIYRAVYIVNIYPVSSRSIRRNRPRVMRCPESERIDLGCSPSGKTARGTIQPWLHFLTVLWQGWDVRACVLSSSIHVCRYLLVDGGKATEARAALMFMPVTESCISSTTTSRLLLIGDRRDGRGGGNGNYRRGGSLGADCWRCSPIPFPASTAAVSPPRSFPFCK